MGVSPIFDERLKRHHYSKSGLYRKYAIGCGSSRREDTPQLKARDAWGLSDKGTMRMPRDAVL